MYQVFQGRLAAIYETKDSLSQKMGTEHWCVWGEAMILVIPLPGFQGGRRVCCGHTKGRVEGTGEGEGEVAGR
jgi:hypothetical protein